MDIAIEGRSKPVRLLRAEGIAETLADPRGVLSRAMLEILGR
jgi:hypothetical protein